MAADDPRPVLLTLGIVVRVEQNGGSDAKDSVVMGNDLRANYKRVTS
jgi:hypothetical protein